MPARLATVKTATNKGPGAYMECTNANYNATGALYIEFSANLKWILTSDGVLGSLIGAVTLQGSFYNYYFGRINETARSGTKYTQVSKVYVDETSSFWYETEMESRASATRGYEVLVCNS
jgi:hypothetical protein